VVQSVTAKDTSAESGGSYMESTNPATGEVLGRYKEYSRQEVDDILSEARDAYTSWRTTGFDQRSSLMRRAAQYLRDNKARFAGLITAEMGKPIAEAEAEVEKCAWNCEFYAEQASTFLADQQVKTSARESLVAFEPLGVVLAIMPWNFPFWQVFRFAAPALMAGNTSVLKHASNVPQCALAIEEVFRESGFPRGAFRTLLVSSSEVDRIISDERIIAVTLTGSSGAGSKVASSAGRALKKAVLELGGSDPFIVLADADLDGAVQFAVRSRFQNTGQSCIATKRIILEEEIADEFEQRFIEAVRNLSVGNPTDRNVNIGPLARADLLDDLDHQVEASLKEGAKLVVGGHRIEGRGNFYEPTVLINVRPDMTAFQEETFGPVAPITRVANADEAVRVANDSEYGLGGNLWTRDTERGKELARRIESGSVFINGMTASDPRLPFGGIKHSGYGRELSSFGIHEFTNIQTIWVGPAVDAGTQQVASE
jgi:acyl-CoA reductase-like NAD-dependent aldehyde dehydrogenase